MTELSRPSHVDLQGRLRSVLIHVSDLLPSVTVQLVDEMIDANENGVALELLCEMLVESGVELTSAIRRDVRWLVDAMGLDPVNLDRLSQGGTMDRSL